MNRTQFKYFKEMCKDKKVVEEDLQYRGDLFLSLTSLQAYKIAEVLKESGFPVVTDSNSPTGKSVELTNGLRLHLL